MTDVNKDITLVVSYCMGDDMERYIIVVLSAVFLIVLIFLIANVFNHTKTEEIKKIPSIRKVKRKKSNNEGDEVKNNRKKLQLPSELALDGHFEAYVLKYFINEYIIKNNMTSPDDIECKKDINNYLVSVIVARGMEHGCFQLQYNNDVKLFMCDCEELYNEIIKTYPKYDPSKANCTYFKVQNEIAMGETVPKYSTDNDILLDSDVLSRVHRNSTDITQSEIEYKKNAVIAHFSERLLKEGFTYSQINELALMAAKGDDRLDEVIANMRKINMEDARIKADHLGDVDVDGLLNELGLQ